MAAAPELGRDPLHVHVAFAPETHLHLTVTLAEEARNADRRDRARIIDELLGLDDLLRHRPRREDQPGEAAVVAHLDASERLAEPPERVGGTALVEAPRDERRIGARLDERARGPERPRRHVRAAEGGRG